MSITVQFSVSAKRKNSTFIPVMRDSAECTFKNGCSMLNPTLLLNIRTDTFPDYTFFKIDNRIYEITDIRTVRNDLFEIDGKVDVLATYKNEIGASMQYVSRTASASDPFIQDNLYPAKASVIVENTLLSDLGFTSTEGLGTYILGVLSEESSGSAVTYYAIGPGRFPELMEKLFDPTYLNATDISTELQKELVNPMQYIVSCYWVPFNAENMNFTTVKFGWWDSGVRAFLLSPSDRIHSADQEFTLPVHPQNARGIFLNDAPYTRHTLHCYTFGSIPINPAPFVTGQTGHIYIDVDLFTGIGQCRIECFGSRIFNQVSQIGVPIQLSQSTGNIIGSAIATFDAVSSAIAGNVLGVAHGITSAVSNAMPQVQTQGANGSIVAYLQTPNIVSEFRQIADENNIQNGRPLCQTKTINTLSGYVLCENAEISLAATEQEKLEVLSYLNNGFFYE